MMSGRASLMNNELQSVLSFSYAYFTQLCTKNVVITRVINDPTNFRTFPI